jgi:hypothetical protein
MKDKTSAAFTDEERAAMKDRAQEQKAAARRGPRAAQADGESDRPARSAAESLAVGDVAGAGQVHVAHDRDVGAEGHVTVDVQPLAAEQ